MVFPPCAISFLSYLKLTPHFALQEHICNMMHAIVRRVEKSNTTYNMRRKNALDWVKLNGAQPSAYLGLHAINFCGGSASWESWRDDNKIPLESWCEQSYATWVLSLLDKKPMYTLSTHKLTLGSPKARPQATEKCCMVVGDKKSFRGCETSNVLFQ